MLVMCLNEVLAEFQVQDCDQNKSLSGITGRIVLKQKQKHVELLNE